MTDWSTNPFTYLQAHYEPIYLRAHYDPIYEPIMNPFLYKPIRKNINDRNDRKFLKMFHYETHIDVFLEDEENIK